MMAPRRRLAAALRSTGGRMRDFDAVIFDLDGTLWDTCDACAVGWNRVMARHRIAFRPITAADVRSVAGRPHDVCIREVFTGLPEAQLAVLIAETQEEDNRAVSELGGALYPGVAAGLPRLRRHYPLHIVSNCQSGYIEVFLERNALCGVFSDFECWGNTGRSKAENLHDLIARNRLSAPLFVGDTTGDEAAAAACKVAFVHASYGFGACPDAKLRVASFAELVELLDITEH
jgi:phosphoglycolate phosphatase